VLFSSALYEGALVVQRCREEPQGDALRSDTGSRVLRFCFGTSHWRTLMP
jgi:hypothetical protein